MKYKSNYFIEKRLIPIFSVIFLIGLLISVVFKILQNDQLVGIGFLIMSIILVINGLYGILFRKMAGFFVYKFMVPLDSVIEGGESLILGIISFIVGVLLFVGSIGVLLGL